MQKVEHELNNHGNGTRAIEIIVNKSVTMLLRVKMFPWCGTLRIIRCKVWIRS
jgi:hypothetical protein